MSAHTTRLSGLIDDGLLTTVWDAESFSLSSFIGSGVDGGLRLATRDDGDVHRRRQAG